MLSKIKKCMKNSNIISKVFNFISLQFDYDEELFSQLLNEHKIKILVKLFTSFVDKKQISETFQNIFDNVDIENEKKFINYFEKYSFFYFFIFLFF